VSRTRKTGETYFLPYQREWIRDEATLRICEKGRQIGLSYADSYDSVRKAAAQGGRDVWVMSRDEVQAKEYIRYCKRWAAVLKHAAEDYGERVFDDAAGRPVKVQVLTFASGASIYALSSNPDAIVGKSGHVKLDEFALHKDQRTLYAVAKPVIQWGGTLSVISTHRGIGTVFNQIIQDIRERGNPMGWSLHSVPIQAAVEQGLVEKIDAATGGRLSREYEADRASGKIHELIVNYLGGNSGQKEIHERFVNYLGGNSGEKGAPGLRDWWLAKQRAECIDEEQWLQEYCCVPADEAAAFITYEMITACEEDGARKDWRYLEGLDPRSTALYVGMDVARKEDLSVIDVEEQVGDVVWERMRIELRGRTYGEQEAELYRVLSLPSVRRCCIDATGLGGQLAERARERFGWKVEPVVFTPRVKEDLAFPLRAAHEDRRLRYARDERLRADLRGVRKTTTSAGNLRFEGEAGDSHCDRFWAKALALHAASVGRMGFGAVMI